MTKSNSKSQLLQVKPIPFLRWAGGKRWLRKDIDSILFEISFTNYHELFLGGGALFFHLSPNKSAYLNDLNCELVDCYQCLRDNPVELIDELKRFKNTKEDYYKVRKASYRSSIRKSARFIYLNQTSFNGIYRVNLNGEYNVPYGYRKKDFIDEENLLSASSALSSARFNSTDFSKCIENIKKNDLVFLDPPYTVAHNNNGFIKYNQKLFSLEDQHRLYRFICELKEIGAYYIMTNAAHSKIKEIFGKTETMKVMNRASLVGGKKALRGSFSEFLFTNVKIK